VIYRYTTRHSDPEELADVLARIYALMASSNAPMDGEGPPPFGPPGIRNEQNVNEEIRVNNPPPLPILPRPYEQGFYLDDRYVINKTPPREQEPVNQDRDNFIVDLKTGSIVMVVERDILIKLKELIKELDVPKKMVQLDVLLFEKRLNRENNFGLNLLRIGSCASHKNDTCVDFNNHRDNNPLIRGIFEFMLSRKPNDAFPAFDLTYRFLLTQEDIHINANPSVLAINQTPATIEIAEEISVNTGIFSVETVGGVTLENAFARAQYGIKIDITPTIHLADEEDSEYETDYVTMVTDVTFQTFAPAADSRPNVTTRHILNEVSIPNNQTVILGGLRQRTTRDRVEKIPYLGELPCLGKLFSITEMHDNTTEMFIFITPRIVYDPVYDLIAIREEEITRRPGDIPAFLCRVQAAEEWESNRLFANSMMILFGERSDRCYLPAGEYDGR
jgi:general secretion pathway protein D